MLRFQTTPDSPFLDILDEAINETLGTIDMEADLPEEQQESFRDEMPRSSTFFTPQEAKQQLEVLQRASRANELYQPTDYHWLLLYEVLDHYCALFNDDPCGMPLEKYGIKRLDIGFMVDLFFWDTDFLDDGIADMPLVARKALDVSPETFGLAMGLKPHPEELALKLHESADEEPPEGYFIQGSNEYPSLRPSTSEGCPDDL